MAATAHRGREANPVAAWTLAHGGVWAFLGVKVLVFAVVLAVAAVLRRAPLRWVHVVLWAALGVAIIAQAWATWVTATVVITRGV